MTVCIARTLARPGQAGQTVALHNRTTAKTLGYHGPGRRSAAPYCCNGQAEERTRPFIGPSDPSGDLPAQALCRVWPAAAQRDAIRANCFPGKFASGQKLLVAPSWVAWQCAVIGTIDSATCMRSGKQTTILAMHAARKYILRLYYTISICRVIKNTKIYTQKPKNTSSIVFNIHMYVRMYHIFIIINKIAQRSKASERSL